MLITNLDLVTTDLRKSNNSNHKSSSMSTESRSPGGTPLVNSNSSNTNNTNNSSKSDSLANRPSTDFSIDAIMGRSNNYSIQQQLKIMDYHHYHGKDFIKRDEEQSYDEEEEIDEKHNSKAKRARRKRTQFSQDQLVYLEGLFCVCQYLTVAERSKVAKDLCLSETQVKTWFQNRRTKSKRQRNTIPESSIRQHQHQQHEYQPFSALMVTPRNGFTFPSSLN
uniref:Homeobox domain-containing protein n=2 Tax=Tetranychus urticae TaxID=32264 RepID=T1L1W3_TETUR